MSDTPRTDACERRPAVTPPGVYVVQAAFARELERELNDLRAKMGANSAWVDRCSFDMMRQDRDYLAEQVQSLTAQLAEKERQRVAAVEASWRWESTALQRIRLRDELRAALNVPPDVIDDGESDAAVKHALETIRAITSERDRLRAELNAHLAGAKPGELP